MWDFEIRKKESNQESWQHSLQAKNFYSMLTVCIVIGSGTRNQDACLHSKCLIMRLWCQGFLASFLSKTVKPHLCITNNRTDGIEFAFFYEIGFSNKWSKLKLRNFQRETLWILSATVFTLQQYRKKADTASIILACVHLEYAAFFFYFLFDFRSKCLKTFRVSLWISCTECNY